MPPANGGGGGQVLIKSVNGKVVITPVPGTGYNPPLPPPAAAPAFAPSKPLSPAAQMTVTVAGGKPNSGGSPLLNGGGSMVDHSSCNNVGESNGQVGYRHLYTANGTAGCLCIFI